MTDTPTPASEIPTDPNNEPVKSINGVHSTVLGSVVALTLNTVRIGWKPDGTMVSDRIVAARLRFDLEIAKVLRDQLDIQIAALTKPAGPAN